MKPVSNSELDLNYYGASIIFFIEFIPFFYSHARGLLSLLVFQYSIAKAFFLTSPNALNTCQINYWIKEILAG